MPVIAPMNIDSKRRMKTFLEVSRTTMIVFSYLFTLSLIPVQAQGSYDHIEFQENDTILQGTAQRFALAAAGEKTV